MKIKIKTGILLPLVIVSLIFSERRVFLLIAAASVILHELGHIAAARLLGIGLTDMSIDLLGARLNTHAPICSYTDEILLCAAGPAANIISSALFYLISGSDEYKSFFIAASLFLAVLNLLPVVSFDGGRILRCVISALGAPMVADRLLPVLSFSVCFTLWIISVYLLLRAGASLSLFIFSVSLFCRIFVSE